MKLLRAIALDPSDTFIFEPPAEPGDWAVSGAFRFWDRASANLEGKERIAFRSGFLGVQSWGWSTLVQIVDARAEDRAALVELLAQQLVDKLGAPGLETARRAADEEVTFVESLCQHPLDTLVAVHRTWESGEVREVFRTLRAREGAKPPLRAFAYPEIETGDEPADRVDLLGMAAAAEAERKRK